MAKTLQFGAMNTHGAMKSTTIELKMIALKFTIPFGLEDYHTYHTLMFYLLIRFTMAKNGRATHYGQTAFM